MKDPVQGVSTLHAYADRPLDRGAWPEVGQLREVGAHLHFRGWSLGTSSNYSVVVGRDPLRLLVTASGKHKGKLTPHDFVVVDEHGKPARTGDPKPSAETMLHCVLARSPAVGAVLHTHSVWGTLLSDRYHRAGGFALSGYEMLKGLAGVGTHEHRQPVVVFENTQDIPTLAKEVAARTEATPPLTAGFLIRRHGLYTWGKDLDEAFRQVEIFEFLFEVVGRGLATPGYDAPGVEPLNG
jgi:methylthioribulose-1-phosphate dehydratase